MILVVGATGTLGNLVARQLIAKGHSVRALTRDPSKATELAAAGAEIARGAGVVSETTDQTFDPTTFLARYPIALTPLEEWATVDPRQRNRD